MSHDQKCYELEIVDTAGGEDYMQARESYYRSADGFLLVFSVDEPESFKHTLVIKEELETFNRWEQKRYGFGGCGGFGNCVRKIRGRFLQKLKLGKTPS